MNVKYRVLQTHSPQGMGVVWSPSFITASCEWRLGISVVSKEIFCLLWASSNFFLQGTVERVEGISLVCSLWLQLQSRSSAMSSVLLARGLALGSAFACMNTHFSFYFFLKILVLNVILGLVCLCFVCFNH